MSGVFVTYPAFSLKNSYHHMRTRIKLVHCYQYHRECRKNRI